MNTALATNTFIGQQFAAWLGHPELRAELREDFIAGRYEIRLGSVSVYVPVSEMQQLRAGPVDDMPQMFQAWMNR